MAGQRGQQGAPSHLPFQHKLTPGPLMLATHIGDKAQGTGGKRRLETGEPPHQGERQIAPRHQGIVTIGEELGQRGGEPNGLRLMRRCQ